MNPIALDILSYAVAAAFVAMVAVVIFIMFKYNSKICDLLLEPTGKGSLSRFQLLFFTITIGGAYLVRYLTDGDARLNETALALLGISSGSFLVSKGISAANTGPTTTVNIRTQDGS